jgi:hypothetical protein
MGAKPNLAWKASEAGLGGIHLAGDAVIPRGAGGFEQGVVERGGMALPTGGGGGDNAVDIDEAGEAGAEPEVVW